MTIRRVKCAIGTRGPYANRLCDCELARCKLCRSREANKRWRMRQAGDPAAPPAQRQGTYPRDRGQGLW